MNGTTVRRSPGRKGTPQTEPKSKLPQTVADVLGKHVVLEVESIDRMYLNAIVPRLQIVEGAVHFIRQQRRAKVASTNAVEPMTRACVVSVERFVEQHQIPMVNFHKGQRKDELAAQMRARFPERDGVVFVGKAQEKCTVYRTEKRHSPKTKLAYAWIVKSAALVNHYYFDANQPARLPPADPPARGFTSARPLLISSMNMIRRSFLETMSAAGALAGAGLAQTGTVKRTGIYLLEIYDFKAGTQPARFHNYMSKSALPTLGKVHSGPKLVMDAVIAPHSPQSMVILGFQSVEELWSVHAKVSQDRELEKASEDWQAGAEPPFEQQTNMILEATSFSPEIVPLDPPPKAPRLFELRVYHSPTRRQLQALEERFAGPEIRIFHRVGVHPILYGSTVIGPNMPNLTYVIPFDDLAAREKAWSAFGSDPEWAKVRQESVEKSGQISNIIQISIYQATAYSPIR